MNFFELKYFKMAAMQLQKVGSSSLRRAIYRFQISIKIKNSNWYC